MRVRIFFVVSAIAGSALWAASARAEVCHWASAADASAALGRPVVETVEEPDPNCCVFEGQSNDKEFVLVNVTRCKSEGVAGALYEDFRRACNRGIQLSALGDSAIFFENNFGGVLVVTKGRFSIRITVNRYDKENPLPGMKILAASVIRKTR
jgi:hypothetical protein